LLPPRDRVATRDDLWALPVGHAPGDSAGAGAADDEVPTQPRDWASYYALRRVRRAHISAFFCMH
jgi:hypothetical protein